MKSIKKRKSGKAPATPRANAEYFECIDKCEALATAAVQGYDEKQNLAVLSLLNLIANASDAGDAHVIATAAMLAAFKAADSLHDAAIELIIASNHSQIREIVKTEKGGEQ